jgi:metal-responsive CopG/Arc/MetJ family transcriptional regulator
MLEVSLSPEVMKSLDEVVELLDFGSREELVLCVLRRFLDRYRFPDIKAC